MRLRRSVATLVFALALIGPTIAEPAADTRNWLMARSERVFFAVRYVDCVEVRAVLSEAYPSVRFQTDPRLDLLVAEGPSTTLDAMREHLARLDQPVGPIETSLGLLEVAPKTLGAAVYSAIAIDPRVTEDHREFVLSEQISPEREPSPERFSCRYRPPHSLKIWLLPSGCR